jgi:hypothetical protein
MKKWVMVVLAAAMSLAVALTGGVAFADSPGLAKGANKYQAEMALNPRFPVVGQEAELTLRISHDGAPEKGLAVTLALAYVEEKDDHSEEEGMAAAKEGKMEATPEKEKTEAKSAAAMATGREMDMAGSKSSDSGTEAKSASVPSSDKQAGNPDDHKEATVRAVEMAPGVYVVRHVFVKGGKWEVKAEIEQEHVDFVVGVRATPVAWPFVGGMGAFVIAVAAAVAAIKTAKKEW